MPFHCASINSFLPLSDFISHLHRVPVRCTDASRLVIDWFRSITREPFGLSWSSWQKMSISSKTFLRDWSSRSPFECGICASQGCNLQIRKQFRQFSVERTIAVSPSGACLLGLLKRDRVNDHVLSSASFLQGHWCICIWWKLAPRKLPLMPSMSSDVSWRGPTLLLPDKYIERISW